MAHDSIDDLLAAAKRNEPVAWSRLMDLVYEDLKRIAHQQMARIAPGQTLSTTVLVHESFEKLAAQQGLPAASHSDFCALSACAMRQIIIDHYRRRSALKRQAHDPELLAEHEMARTNVEADNALEALGRVLDDLLECDQRLVEVFELRYFGGLSDQDIAQRLEISPRSVQRYAARARAWIADSLDSGG